MSQATILLNNPPVGAKNMFGEFQQYMGMGGYSFSSPLFLLLLIWSLAWKGVALWKAARRGEKVWYVAILIVNTVGILEILYIYVFSKKSKSVE